MKNKDAELSCEELARRERVREEQRQLAEELSGVPEYTRPCPYCGYWLLNIYSGNHGYSKIKCPKCKETVIFTPFLCPEEFAAENLINDVRYQKNTADMLLKIG